MCSTSLSRSVCRRLCLSSCAASVQRNSAVIGVFRKDSAGDSLDAEAVVTEDDLTSAGKALNARSGGKILNSLNCVKPLVKGQCRTLFGICEEFHAVSVVGIGPRGIEEIDPVEGVNLGRENCRTAAAVGVSHLQELGVTQISVDSLGHADAAAEGAHLALYKTDLWKKEQSKLVPAVNLLQSGSSNTEESWDHGRLLALGQNRARKLMDTPANLLTPTIFADEAARFATEAGFDIQIHDKKWAEERKMGAFLSVAQGSAEPPKFVEMTLNRSDKPPIVMVGKGVCFDSGGISLKPGSNMDAMRGDMGGAAVVLGAAWTLGKLLKIGAMRLGHLKVLIPMVENMPSGTATRPGDIVTAMNGKTIKVDNTDAEGRLILADALCYADTFNPGHVIDVATLTGAMMVALGTGAAGVFTNCNNLFEHLQQAGSVTGDRVWRMPLFSLYKSKLKSDYADLNNISKPNAGAGSCTAAAFLQEFTKCTSWAHMDIAGVMDSDPEYKYLRKGMSGRPTRTLVQTVRTLAKNI